MTDPRVPRSPFDKKIRKAESEAEAQEAAIERHQRARWAPLDELKELREASEPDMDRVGHLQGVVEGREGEIRRSESFPCGPSFVRSWSLSSKGSRRTSASSVRTWG